MAGNTGLQHRCGLGGLMTPAATGLRHEEPGLEPRHCAPPLAPTTAPQLLRVQLSVGTCGDGG